MVGGHTHISKKHENKKGMPFSQWAIQHSYDYIICPYINVVGLYTWWNGVQTVYMTVYFIVH